MFSAARSILTTLPSSPNGAPGVRRIPFSPAVGARDDVAEFALPGALYSRVVDAGEAVDDGYGCGLRLFHAAFPVGRLPQFQRMSRILF